MLRPHRVLSQSLILGQNPKIGHQKFNDLQAPKLSKKQLCDRTPKRSLRKSCHSIPVALSPFVTPSEPAMRTHHPMAAPSNPSLPLLGSLPHPCAGCGHGGTRNSSTSRSVQTCSVRPAALAGVRGCQRLAEPVPCVGSGGSSGWRK